MKIIDNYLDKYYARKVIDLACGHLAAVFNLKTVVNYDSVLKEWLIEAVYVHNNNNYTIPYLRLPRRSAPEILFRLLFVGWKELDYGSDTCLGLVKRINDIKEQQ